jgi:hypothetical protein
MTDTTNAGPVLPLAPELRVKLRNSGYLTWIQARECDQNIRADIEAYGLQCWNACDEQVAGPLRERVAELEAQNSELERLCDEKYCATGADAYHHCCEQTEAWDTDRLKKGLAPIYGPGEGRSLCGWIESIRELLDNADAELDRLRAECEALRADLEWVSVEWGGKRHDYSVWVLRRGGTGDLGDLRSFIDAARAAREGK